MVVQARKLEEAGTRLIASIEDIRAQLEGPSAKRNILRLIPTSATASEYDSKSP